MRDSEEVIENQENTPVFSPDISNKGDELSFGATRTESEVCTQNQ